MSLDISTVQTTLDGIYGQYAGLLIADGQVLLISLSGILLVCYGVKHGITGGVAWFLVHYGFRILIAGNLLAYYNVPTSILGGYSVSGFFPAVAEYYANLIGNAATADLMYNKIGLILHSVSQQKVGMADFAMIPVSWITQLLMWFLEAVTWGSTAIALVMTGILRILGPLFIPWMIFDAVNWLFWNWMKSLMQYSFFRVVAALVVLVVSGTMNHFIDQSLHGDYSLAHLAVLLPQLVVVTAFSMVLALRSPQIVADLFQGGASAASNAWGSIANAAKSVKSAVL